MQNSTTTAYQINDDNLILLEWLTLLQNSFKDSGEEMSVSLPAIRRLSDELKATGFRYEYENPENNTILWSIGRNTLLRMREGKMRENELQKLQKWDDALLRYKFLYKVTLSQDKDALAHAVLDKLMQCYSNGSTHLTLEEPNDTQLACELVNVGMVCIPSNHNNTFFGPHQWKFLHYSPEALTKLTAAASEVRAEYHLEISRRQIHELAQIMASTFPVGEMITNVDFEDARRTLREFVQRFRDNYGAKPFLYGLRHVLQATHKAEKCQIWILHNDVFTQSGGAEFLNASVALLKVLDFRPRTPIDQWQFDGQDHRNKFSVSPLWSDKQLSHLLNTIPRPAQDEKPHGEFGESVVPRRPQPDQQGSSGGGFFQAAKEWTKSWWYGDTSSSAPKPATRKRERSPDDEPARTAIGDSVRAAAQSVPPPLVPNAPPSSHPPPLVPSSSSTNSNFSRGFGGAQQQQQHFHQHQADTRPSVEHFDQPAAKRARPNSSSNMGPVATPQQQQQQQQWTPTAPPLPSNVATSGPPHTPQQPSPPRPHRPPSSTTTINYNLPSSLHQQTGGSTPTSTGGPQPFTFHGSDTMSTTSSGSSQSIYPTPPTNNPPSLPAHGLYPSPPTAPPQNPNYQPPRRQVRSFINPNLLGDPPM